MALILPGVLSLSQHVDTLRKEPESYRPKRCPRCGHAILWCHGCYTRKSDPTGVLNPVSIPRFFCPSPDCRSTCSMLPECIPPRSWYLWQVRQVVFLLLLTGNSLNATVASNGSLAGRQTIQRWFLRVAHHGVRGLLRPRPHHRHERCLGLRQRRHPFGYHRRGPWHDLAEERHCPHVLSIQHPGRHRLHRSGI